MISKDLCCINPSYMYLHSYYSSQLKQIAHHSHPRNIGINYNFGNRHLLLCTSTYYSLFTIRWQMTLFSFLSFFSFFLLKKVISHLRQNKPFTRCGTYVQLETTAIMSNVLQLYVHSFGYYIRSCAILQWTDYRMIEEHGGSENL